MFKLLDHSSLFVEKSNGKNETVQEVGNGKPALYVEGPIMNQLYSWAKPSNWILL